MQRCRGNLPDGKTLIGYRLEPGDDQLVYLIETCPPEQLRAKLRHGVYPQPGDKYTTFEMYAFDKEAKQPIQVKMDAWIFGAIRRGCAGKRTTNTCP